MLPKYNLIQIQDISIDDIISQLKIKFNNHTVVHLSENVNISNELISLFLKNSNDLKENGMSFVVVQSGVDVDSFPEELNLVPTIQEAEDVLEMEAIERDLGF